MKLKFLLTILLLMTTVCLFSFINKEKSKSKKAKFFSCAPTSSPSKVGRGGYYVSIDGRVPQMLILLITDIVQSITGRSFSGKTYSTQDTVDDHNEGGTITITSHCSDSTTSGASHGTWTAN